MKKILKIIKNLLTNEYLLISGILIIGFVVRLYKVGNPLADWHSWRQVDTASVTREYIKNGVDLLYPRYHDISSIQTGITNMEGYRFVEFPIFNAIHAFLTVNFPFFSLEIWGRLISIICSLISGLMVYLLGKKLFGKWVGILSLFFFMFLPFNIYYSRVILPEPMSIMFGLVSMVLFVYFLEKKKNSLLYLSGVFFALGMLLKPFVFFFSVPLIYLSLKKFKLKKILSDSKILIPFLIFAFIALVPFFLWRIWINQYPIGTPFYKWMFNGDKIRFKPSFWRWIFTERIGNLILGGWGLVPFVVGIMKPRKNQFVNFFLLGLFFYTAMFASVNVMHDYYQVVTIPAVSLALALGLFTMWEGRENKILVRSVLVFSMIIMFLSSAVQIKEYYKINHPEIIMAGEAIDKLADKDDLIIAPYNGDTALLYQTKRRGWPVVDVGLDKVIEKGARYFVSTNYADPDIGTLKERGYKVIEERGEYIIIDLRK